ncbi:MAG: Do family serine endopeptidase [Chitinivibrionales bacterium]|nr:Do family serine endopeptidase [Chitinivibrionales bacterium]
MCLISSSLLCSSKPQAPQTISAPVLQQNVLEKLTDTTSFRTIFADIAAQVTPCVVSVIITKIDTITENQNPFFDFFSDSSFDSPFEFFFRNPNQGRRHGRSNKPNAQKHEYREQGLGSGVIISADGFILTNYHVVAGASELQVKLTDERSFQAKIIGVDSLSDVAVIKIKEKIDHLPVAVLGDDAKLRPGDWALAIGNPFSLTSTVTLGIVSALHREVGDPNLYQNYIQTDAAINPGNSGGALVNVEGKVIGINTLIYSRTGGFMGIGFAIPISLAKMVMEELIKSGKVTRGWMGVSIQNMNKSISEALNLGDRKGVLVGDVYKGQPADRAGIKRGDVILSIGGKPVESANALRNSVAELPPGTKTPVVVFRNGKELTLEMTVAARNEKTVSKLGETASGKAAPVAKEKEQLGLTLADLTPDLRAKYNVPEGKKGVVVRQVSPSLGDARAGLKEGDLVQQIKIKEKDFQDVESVRQLSELTKKLHSGDAVLLLVARGEETFYVAFSL